jgi:hypothetical protein
MHVEAVSVDALLHSRLRTDAQKPSKNNFSLQTRDKGGKWGNAENAETPVKASQLLVILALPPLVRCFCARPA